MARSACRPGDISAIWQNEPFVVVAVRSSCGDFRVIASTGLALVLAIAPAHGANSGAEPKRAFFGNLHLHTAYCFDAFIFKTTATPDEVRCGRDRRYKARFQCRPKYYR